MRIFFLTFFAFFGQGIALTITNPALPCLINEGFVLSDRSWTHFETAVVGDYLWKKSFQEVDSSRKKNVSDTSFSGLTELGFASWSIRERLLLQLYLGSGQYDWRFLQNNQAVNGLSRGGICLGSDAKLVLFSAKDTIFAIDGQVGGWDFMRGFASVNDEVKSPSVHSNFRYWQVGVGVTQQIGYFSPYIGCAIQKSWLKIWHLQGLTYRFISAHSLGPYVGCSLSSGDYFLLNLEWRGLFENGFSLAGQIRF